MGPRDVSSWDTIHFQGGGALGAYEWGVWEALAEKGMDFSLVSGVSIGAVNAAIVASRGAEAPTFLGRFWDEVADPWPAYPFLPSPVREEMASTKSFLFGNPSMFLPRWMGPPFPALWPDGRVAFYDPAPLRNLVKKYVDYRALGSSRRGLIVSAVDVESGEVRLFDSRQTRIGPDHIMASGALPPAFPPVRIEGRSYWDGGLVNNSPIWRTVRSLPPDRLRRVLLVELFPRRHPLPRNVRQTLEVLKDFTYMSRGDSESERHQETKEVQALLQRLLTEAGPLARKMGSWPEFREIAQRYADEVRLYRISHAASAEDGVDRDVDFSPQSLKRRREQGRRAALEDLARWEKEATWAPFACQPLPR